MEGMKPLLPPSYGFSINNLSHIFLHLVSEITIINLKRLDICSIFYMPITLLVKLLGIYLENWKLFACHILRKLPKFVDKQKGGKIESHLFWPLFYHQKACRLGKPSLAWLQK
jgi:hypothetical protein